MSLSVKSVDFSSLWGGGFKAVAKSFNRFLQLIDLSLQTYNERSCASPLPKYAEQQPGGKEKRAAVSFKSSRSASFATF